MGGQIGIVLLLGLHLAGQLRIFRLELGALGNMANGEEKPCIGKDRGRDGNDEENDPAFVRCGSDRIQPAEHEQILTGGENTEQKPVPPGQIKFDPVDQQTVKGKQHDACDQIWPQKQNLTFRAQQLWRTGQGFRRIVQRRADNLVGDHQQEDHCGVKQHPGPRRIENQDTDGKEQRNAENGADGRHEGQTSGHNDAEDKPDDLQQIGDMAAEPVRIGEVHHEKPGAAV